MEQEKNSTIIIEGKKIAKKYGSRYVLTNVDFSVYKGECFGILGPNGAGKSTLMRLIYCSSALNKGNLYVLGWNVNDDQVRIKQNIGIIPQDNGLDPDFSVLDNLLIYARYHNIPLKQAKRKSLDLLRLMKLEKDIYSPVEILSGGMQRRLTICRGLINDPPLLILDEPTTGLDPQVRHWIWDIISQFKREGKTILLTTHYMEEAEKNCDRIAIMNEGRIVTLGSPKDLILENVGEEVVEIYLKNSEIHYCLERLKEEKFICQPFHNKILVYFSSYNEKDRNKIVKLMDFENMIIRKANLDDVFLKLTGHELRDGA